MSPSIMREIIFLCSCWSYRKICIGVKQELRQYSVIAAKKYTLYVLVKQIILAALNFAKFMLTTYLHSIYIYYRNSVRLSRNTRGGHLPWGYG